MTASPVEIANSALMLLGEDPIISFDDPRTAARLLTTQYDIERRKLLRAYRWKFAMARAILAPEADAPLFGFSYKFLLPTDCLQFVGIYDPNTPDYQINYTGSDVVFKIEGRYVLCDTNPLYCFYIRDVDLPVDMDAIFVEALAAALAMKLAMPLTNDTGKYQLAKDMFADNIKQARIISAMEGTPEVHMASDWLDSRYNGISGARDSLIGY